MNTPTFRSIVLKTTLVHTATYFLIGLLAFTILDYSARFEDPIVARLMRQTGHPLVAAGPVFQLVRGFLFGIVFYALRDAVFGRPRGWLTLWLVLVVVGILSPFGAAPASIEGAIYTVMPAWFHITGLPEIVIQSGLLAFFTHYWVTHPEKKWLAAVFGLVCAAAVLLSGLGILAALGLLPPGA
jgi:hypothetical protein